ALRDTPLRADAERGLGLLAAARGDVGGAVAALARARDARPTDARIRNDLGYALLLAGQSADAEAELLTAVELGEAKRASRNLVLLLFLREEEAAARALAERSGLSSDLVARIRARADALRRDPSHAPAVGGAPS